MRSMSTACPAFMQTKSESCPRAKNIGDKCVLAPTESQTLKICIEKRYTYNDICKNDAFAKEYITCSDPDQIVDQFVTCYDNDAFKGEYKYIPLSGKRVDMDTEFASDESGWHFGVKKKTAHMNPTICGSRFADPDSPVRGLLDVLHSNIC